MFVMLQNDNYLYMPLSNAHLSLIYSGYVHCMVNNQKGMYFVEKRSCKCDFSKKIQFSITNLDMSNISRIFSALKLE